MPCGVPRLIHVDNAKTFPVLAPVLHWRTAATDPLLESLPSYGMPVHSDDQDFCAIPASTARASSFGRCPIAIDVTPVPDI